MTVGLITLASLEAYPDVVMPSSLTGLVLLNSEISGLGRLILEQDLHNGQEGSGSCAQR
jgi:hypothetical protein